MPKSSDFCSYRGHFFIGGLLDCRHISFVLAVCFLWWHLCERPAHADPGSIEVGAKLAPSLEEFNGDREAGAENAYKLGASVGAGLHIGIVGPVGAQVEILYATRGTDVALGDRTVGSFYFTYIEVPVLARVALRIPGLAGDGQRSPLSAHAVAGGAVSHLLGAVREDGSGTMELNRSALNSNDFSAIAGLGLTWDVTPSWAASFEVRYDMGFVDAFQDTSDGRETKNRAILFTFGVGYTLNDGDGDGVIGSRDRCRTRAEDWNGFEDGDGCPDADEDGDGLRGEADACPGEAEDINEYKDDDGCPDADSDEDEDGIAVKDDVCPAQRFPYNRDLAPERRGCPPRFDRVRVEGDWLVFTPPLVFGWGIGLLDDEHKKSLDQVAELLRDYYPAMRLRIEGHADSRTGGRAQRENQKESSNRALAVEAYLLALGVPPDRLVAKGYGEDRPNYTENPIEGQEGNRRVELIIIENPEP